MQQQINPATMSLSELVAALGESRQATTDAYTAYKEQKGIEEQLRYELELKLKAEGLKGTKGANYNAVFTEKPEVIITHEQSVIDWLNESPEIETDQYIGLKKTEFKSLAVSMLKHTGEMIPGTEVRMQESLTIRANNKAKAAKE